MVKIKRVNGTEELPQQYLCLTQLTLLHLVLASFLASLAPSYSMYAHISISILPSNNNTRDLLTYYFQALAFPRTRTYLQYLSLTRTLLAPCIKFSQTNNKWSCIELAHLSSSAFLMLASFETILSILCSPIQLVITIQW